MIIVYKDGVSKVVKARYLSRHLDQGWSQEPPKSKALQKIRATIKAEPEVIQAPIQEESESLPKIEETNDGNL